METAILRESSCERGGRAAILVQLREHFYRDCTLKAHYKVTSDMNTQEKASRLGSVPWDHTRCSVLLYSVARPLRISAGCRTVAAYDARIAIGLGHTIMLLCAEPAVCVRMCTWCDVLPGHMCPVRHGTAGAHSYWYAHHAPSHSLLSLPRLCSCASQLCVTATCSSYGDPGERLEWGQPSLWPRERSNEQIEEGRIAKRRVEQNLAVARMA